MSLPLMGYKAFLRLRGQPFNHQSNAIVVLAGIALFGIVVGLALIGIETIRSAIRDNDGK